MKIPNRFYLALSVLTTAKLITCTPVSQMPLKIDHDHELDLKSDLPFHKPAHPRLLDPALIKALTAPDADIKFDVVGLLKHLDPSIAEELDEPRFIWVFGGDKDGDGDQEVGSEGGRWMTEGDKVVLRRQGKKFVDLTGREGRWSGNKSGSGSEGLKSKNQSEQSLLAKF